MKETLFEKILPKGTTCRPLFDFLCDIDSWQGFFIYALFFYLMNYFFFRVLAKSKFGRFIIGFTFVVFFPFLTFVLFRNGFLFYIYQ